MERKDSNKKAKPSQFMAILGITVILFIIGIFGWMFVSVQKGTEVLKEKIKVNVTLHDNAKEPTKNALLSYITNQPYAKAVEYVSKDEAKKRQQASEDRYKEELIGGENPLPASVEFYVKSNYVQKDSLLKIKNDIEMNSQNIVESVLYPANIIQNMNDFLKWILIGFVVLALIFGTLAIILIDNTIKLSMYSNRFLIKTMQMVGATRNFIVKPINIRSIINALIAAAIAIVLVISLMLLTEWQIPDFKDARDNLKLFYLFGSMVVLGVLISLFSTHRSVIKYLKMKLDDLY